MFGSPVRRLLSVTMKPRLSTATRVLSSPGIFEFGRAYQTWQVVTNASREGARVAVLQVRAEFDACDRVRRRRHDQVDALDRPARGEMDERAVRVTRTRCSRDGDSQFHKSCRAAGCAFREFCEVYRARKNEW